MKKIVIASLFFGFTTAVWNLGAGTEHNRLLWRAVTQTKPMIHPPTIEDQRAVYLEGRWAFALRTAGDIENTVSSSK
jgi:hypothetical protein